MKKRCIVVLCFSLIFIILPYIFNTYNTLRLFSVVLGLFLLGLSLFLNKHNHILLVIVVPLIGLCITYGIDMFMYYSFKRIPIYIHEVKSNDSISTYNSIFYRIYKCNDNMIFDYGYNKSFSCNTDSLKAININDLLLNPEETYINYKNKFIRVHGKISKIVNLDRIELSMWDSADNKINGYVNFNLNYNLSVKVNEDVNDLRIYEEIDVIGRVYKIKDNTIYLTDSVLINNNIYDNWNYEIVNGDKEIKSIGYNYYLYGIDELNIKYTDTEIYELSYLINDKKVTVDNLINNIKASKTYEDKELDIQATKYELEKFNILKCSNEKVIISNKKLKLDINACLTSEE